MPASDGTQPHTDTSKLYFCDFESPKTVPNVANVNASHAYNHQFTKFRFLFISPCRQRSINGFCCYYWIIFMIIRWQRAKQTMGKNESLCPFHVHLYNINNAGWWKLFVLLLFDFHVRFFISYYVITWTSPNGNRTRARGRCVAWQKFFEKISWQLTPDARSLPSATFHRNTQICAKNFYSHSPCAAKLPTSLYMGNGRVRVWEL